MEQPFLAGCPISTKNRRQGNIPLIARAWQVFLDKTEESSHYREPVSDVLWRSICHTLQRQLRRLDQPRVRMLTEHISHGIQWLDPHMDQYCRATCPSCSDPCCTGREVFFNRTDLLYLTSLANDAPPIGQTRAQSRDMCRYLGPTGCRLARMQRPYVCVWFLCEPQMELLNAAPAAFQRQLINVLKNIRTCRLMLEGLYEEHYP